jgi:hypothetical protein
LGSGKWVLILGVVNEGTQHGGQVLNGIVHSDILFSLLNLVGWLCAPQTKRVYVEKEYVYP